MHLSIATWNGGKYKQIVSQLPDFVTPEQIDLDLPEIQANLLTVISFDKCLQAYNQLWRPVVVDDTGIFFEAFNEFPGALSKFLYQGVGMKGMKGMFTEVENKNAYFQTVLSYMDETLSEPVQFIWEIDGAISFDWSDQGWENPKLPYELIFIPHGFDKPAVFDQERYLQGDHHRLQAVKKLAEWLLVHKKV